MTTWRGRTTKDLVEYMAATMPPGRPSLGEAEYLNITAFILQFNGAAAGAQPLAVATTDADRLDRHGPARRGQARRPPRRRAAPPAAPRPPRRRAATR